MVQDFDNPLKGARPIENLFMLCYVHRDWVRNQYLNFAIDKNPVIILLDWEDEI